MNSSVSTTAAELPPAGTVDTPGALAPAHAGMSRSVKLTYVVLLALAVGAPLMGLYPVFGMKILCFALFACAFNLLLGFTGLLSFGHAAFFGFAAYVAGWLVKAQGWTPELGILAGTGVGALLGLVFGAVAIRRQGIYFAMITLALSQMVFFVCLQAPFTGGEDGLQGVPRGNLFGLLPLTSDLTLYYVVLAIFAACFLFILRVVTSPFGQVLKMIRENEPRAISLGYEVDRYKLMAFVLSAALHIDHAYAATTEFGRPLMNSLFTLGLVVGLSVLDTTFGTTVAN